MAVSFHPESKPQHIACARNGCDLGYLSILVFFLICAPCLSMTPSLQQSRQYLTVKSTKLRGAIPRMYPLPFSAILLVVIQFLPTLSVFPGIPPDPELTQQALRCSAQEYAKQYQKEAPLCAKLRRERLGALCKAEYLARTYQECVDNV